MQEKSGALFPVNPERSSMWHNCRLSASQKQTLRYNIRYMEVRRYGRRRHKIAREERCASFAVSGRIAREERRASSVVRGRRLED